MAKKNKKLSKNAKRGIILGSSLFAAGAIVAGYACFINFYLLDLNVMPYIEFSYAERNKEDPNDKNREITVSIDKVYANTNYPAEFRLPNYLKGYKVTSIANNALSYLDRLTSVKLPKYLQTIGDEAFKGCENLKSVSVTGNKLTYIGMDAFKDTPYFDESDDGEFIIGKVLYEYKGSLPANTAVVPNHEEKDKLGTAYSNYICLDDYTFISAGAFAFQSNLVYVDYSGYSEVTENLFEGCTNLTSVKLDDAVITIKDGAFKDCSNLNNIDFPDNLVSIGKYAFSNVNFVGAISLPEKVSSFGEGAFSNNDAITSFAIPSLVSEIPDKAFLNCSALEDVVMSEESVKNTIKRVGKSAFENTAIHSFTLPYSVITLKDSTFLNCPNLTSVKLYEKTNAFDGISKGVQVIEQQVFRQDSSLKEVLLVDEDGNAVSPAGEVSLPHSTLVRIEDSSGTTGIFQDSGVEVVNFPNTLSTIPNAFLKGCTSLKTINFVDNNRKELTPSISRILNDAFSGCSELNNVVIPMTVSTINPNAFKDCTSLSSFEFEEGSKVETITEYQFGGCTSLTSFVTPAGTRSIKANAFDGCSNLEAIVLGAKVATLGDYVFNNCNPNLKIYCLAVNNKNIKNTKWNLKSKDSDETYDTYFYSESEPTDAELSYWHYVDGVPTAW